MNPWLRSAAAFLIASAVASPGMAAPGAAGGFGHAGGGSGFGHGHGGFGGAPGGSGHGHPGFGHGHPGFGHGHPGFGHGHPGFGHFHSGFGHFNNGYYSPYVSLGYAAGGVPFYGFADYGYGGYGYGDYGHGDSGFPGYGLGGYLPAAYVDPYAALGYPTRSFPAFFTLPLNKDYSAAARQVPAAAAPHVEHSTSPAGPTASGTGDAGERFYLEAQPRRPEPDGIMALIRQHLRVERAEPDQYLVRWVPGAEQPESVEFQSVDAKGEVLHSRAIKEAPFRGLLQVPAETTAVIRVIVENRGGAGATFKLPIAEFRKLDASGS